MEELLKRNVTFSKKPEENTTKKMVLTIRQLAEYIADQLDLQFILRKPFPDCDFGLVDTDGITEFDEEELDFLKSGVCGWYGAKKVNTGFDSEYCCIVTDYYGGGCGVFTQLYDSIDTIDAVGDMARAIRHIRRKRPRPLPNPQTLQVQQMPLRYRTLRRLRKYRRKPFALRIYLPTPVLRLLW